MPPPSNWASLSVAGADGSRALTTAGHCFQIVLSMEFHSHAFLFKLIARRGQAPIDPSYITTRPPRSLHQLHPGDSFEVLVIHRLALLLRQIELVEDLQGQPRIHRPAFRIERTVRGEDHLVLREEFKP